MPYIRQIKSHSSCSERMSISTKCLVWTWNMENTRIWAASQLELSITFAWWFISIQRLDRIYTSYKRYDFYPFLFYSRLFFIQFDSHSHWKSHWQSHRKSHRQSRCHSLDRLLWRFWRENAQLLGSPLSMGQPTKVQVLQRPTANPGEISGTHKSQTNLTVPYQRVC